MPNTRQPLLDLYRSSIKPSAPIHRLVLLIANHLAIPCLEVVKGFRTIKGDPFWFRYELLTGRHESETVDYVRQIIKPGMIALDIGAHAGYYSVLFAKLMKKTGQILAFEPNPETLDILRRNVEPFEIVEVIPYAVSDAMGTAELFDYLIMSASGSLHYDESVAEVQRAALSENDTVSQNEAGNALKRFSVQTINLDEYLPSLGIDTVDIIKMDIEGAELTALRGMRGIISASHDLQLIMEYNPQALKAFIDPPESAIGEVLSYGFSKALALMSNGDMKDVTSESELRTLTDSLMVNMGVINVLFLKAAANA